MPGLGFPARDVMTEPFLVHWDIAEGWATSMEIPGVRIPGASFMGVSGVSPSPEKLAAWTAREQRVALDAGGGLAFPPDPDGAVPTTGPCALAGLRTLPPRENGGNFDVKQLTAGAKKLFLPVYGARRPVARAGDGPFRARRRRGLRHRRRDGRDRGRPLQGPQGARQPAASSLSPVFSRANLFHRPAPAAPERFLGVMGMPINASGEIEAENLTLACRNAVLNMMELLQERGFSREQAYVICSVAVDLRISNVVDVPNYVVSALLPEAIFGD